MLTKVESLLDEAMGNCLFMDDVPIKLLKLVMNHSYLKIPEVPQRSWRKLRDHYFCPKVTDHILDEF